MKKKYGPFNDDSSDGSYSTPKSILFRENAPSSSPNAESGISSFVDMATITNSNTPSAELAFSSPVRSQVLVITPSRNGMDSSSTTPGSSPSFLESDLSFSSPKAKSAFLPPFSLPKATVRVKKRKLEITSDDQLEQKRFRTSKSVKKEISPTISVSIPWPPRPVYVEIKRRPFSKTPAFSSKAFMPSQSPQTLDSPISDLQCTPTRCFPESQNCSPSMDFDSDESFSTPKAILFGENVLSSSPDSENGLSSFIDDNTPKSNTNTIPFGNYSRFPPRDWFGTEDASWYSPSAESAFSSPVRSPILVKTPSKNGMDSSPTTPGSSPSFLKSDLSFSSPKSILLGENVLSSSPEPESGLSSFIDVNAPNSNTNSVPFKNYSRFPPRDWFGNVDDSWYSPSAESAISSPVRSPVLVRTQTNNGMDASPTSSPSFLESDLSFSSPKAKSAFLPPFSLPKATVRVKKRKLEITSDDQLEQKRFRTSKSVKKEISPTISVSIPWPPRPVYVEIKRRPFSKTPAFSSKAFMPSQSPQTLDSPISDLQCTPTRCFPESQNCSPSMDFDSDESFSTPKAILFGENVLSSSPDSENGLSSFIDDNTPKSNTNTIPFGNYSRFPPRDWFGTEDASWYSPSAESAFSSPVRSPILVKTPSKNGMDSSPTTPGSSPSFLKSDLSFSSPKSILLGENVLSSSPEPESGLSSFIDVNAPNSNTNSVPFKNYSRFPPRDWFGNVDDSWYSPSAESAISSPVRSPVLVRTQTNNGMDASPTSSPSFLESDLSFSSPKAKSAFLPPFSLPKATVRVEKRKLEIISDDQLAQKRFRTSKSVKTEISPTSFVSIPWPPRPVYIEIKRRPFSKTPALSSKAFMTPQSPQLQCTPTRLFPESQDCYLSTDFDSDEPFSTSKSILFGKNVLSSSSESESGFSSFIDVPVRFSLRLRNESYRNRIE